MDQRRELSRYLDSVRSSYPNGIPKSVFATAAQQSKAASPAQGVHLLIVSKTEMENHSDLINAIIDKGLQVERSRVEIAVASDDLSSWPQFIEQEVARVKPSGTIVFSEEVKIDMSVTIAPTLSIISSNQNDKKRFWEILKGYRSRS